MYRVSSKNVPQARVKISRLCIRLARRPNYSSSGSLVTVFLAAWGSLLTQIEVLPRRSYNGFDELTSSYHANCIEITLRLASSPADVLGPVYSAGLSKTCVTRVPWIIVFCSTISYHFVLNRDIYPINCKQASYNDVHCHAIAHVVLWLLRHYYKA